VFEIRRTRAKLRETARTDAEVEQLAELALSPPKLRSSEALHREVK